MPLYMLDASCSATLSAVHSLLLFMCGDVVSIVHDQLPITSCGLSFLIFSHTILRTFALDGF